MTDRRDWVTGGALLVLGVLFLISNLFQINLWRYVWPLALIGLGVALILRPGSVPFLGPGRFYFFSGVRRSGPGSAASEDFWIFVGDVDLDLRGADWSQPEIVYRVSGFVGDVNLWLPEDAGVSLASQALVSDVDFLGRSTDYFLRPARLTSDGFQEASRKVRVEASFFVSDINVYQGAA
jgi:hypothetical protein